MSICTLFAVDNKKLIYKSSLKAVMIKVNNVNDVNILLQMLTTKPLGLR